MSFQTSGKLKTTKIANSVAEKLKPFKYCERAVIDSGNALTAEVIKKSWNPLRRLFGGHGICALALIPEEVNTSQALNSFFKELRREINSQFVGFCAYKSSHSFIVLLCSPTTFSACSDLAPKLKDRTGLHVNIIQGVILVNVENGEIAGDYSRPSQYKREYDAVLLGTQEAIR